MPAASESRVTSHSVRVLSRNRSVTSATIVKAIQKREWICENILCHAVAEDEVGLTPYEDDNTVWREIGRKDITVLDGLDYI